VAADFRFHTHPRGEDRTPSCSPLQWETGDDKLPDGRPRTLQVRPTAAQRAAVLAAFLRLNISKGVRKDRG
jgi:hypothetical protein